MENEPGAIKRILFAIWPTISRIISGFFYFIFTLVKAGIRIAVRQFGGGE